MPLYRNWPYWARFLTIVTVGLVTNLAGLGVTQTIGWSLLFFDMAGTAFASLLGGAVAGLIVAIFTGLVGAWWIDPHYYIFSIVNIAGALLWAMLPRLGVQRVGGDMFNPHSYRRGLLNILAVGTVVGVICGIISWVIQAYVFKMSVLINNDIAVSLGSGTATSHNNIAMVRILAKMAVNNHIPPDVVIAFSALISNIPDKIIATATAVMIIFMFGTLPNFKQQKEYIRKNAQIVNLKWIDNRVLLFITCLIPAISILYVTWNVMRDFQSMLLMSFFCAFVIMSAFMDHAFLRSIDRLQPSEGEDQEQWGLRSSLFYELPHGGELKLQRETFEDLLKILTVVVSGMSFVLSSYAGGHTTCNSEDLHSFLTCGSLYQLAVVNILILTGYRYVCVLGIRLIRRV